MASMFWWMQRTFWKKCTVSMSSFGAKLTRRFLCRIFLYCWLSSSGFGDTSRFDFSIDDGVRFIMTDHYCTCMLLQ